MAASANSAGGPGVGFPFRLLALLTILPVLLLASIVALYQQQHAERIYPGVAVFGVDVGRLTRQEAVDALTRHLTSESRRRFLLRYDDDVFPVTLAEMGMRIDEAELGEIVERAWATGRVDGILPWLRGQLSLIRHGHAVPAAVSLDLERAAAVLGRVAREVERPMHNADLSVERAGDGFEIHTLPAVTGRRLNVNATLDRITKALAGTIPTRIDLVLDEARPSIADADLVPAQEAIKLLLGSPLEFKDGDRSWKLEPAAAFAMLEITGLDAGKPPIRAKLNDEKLHEFVKKLAVSADQPARNPFFEVEGDQVVIRPGGPGRLMDVDATFELAKERAASPTRTVEIVFVEDKPWLTEADLEPARVQANTRLELPVLLEAPANPGTSDQAAQSTPAGATSQTPPAEQTVRPGRPVQSWLLDRTLLLQMLALPNTQSAPRDYATLPPAQRPQFEVQLDSGKVTAFLAREVAPWVSEDPIDAELVITSTKVDLPNPAYAAAVAAEQRRAAEVQATATPQAVTTPQASQTPRASVTPVPTRTPVAITVPPTIQETHHRVALRNARDGRGPDYLATFSALQIMFRSGMPAEPAERKVTVRLAPRAPRVRDQELAAARDTANQLIGEPIAVRWKDATWTVTRDELAGMLRYQSTNAGLSAYLTRDGLIAKASAIAQEAERRPDAPRDSEGKPLPVDVLATASNIWQQASTVPAGRVDEVVWTEEEPKEETTAPDPG
ncbi:MAG: peptidoglycan binding domain-containing protein [Chloroflexi bacterium]|nr:peptidoglycan binding domain-containing protein [Chloroflexota bacterium]